MPDFWAHYVQGNKVLKRLNLDLSSREKKLFSYFVQGADPFLFTRDERISWEVHKNKPGQFLRCLFKKCDNLPLLLGYLSHFNLDRCTHPYILYIVGDDLKKHGELEFSIDAEIVKMFLKKRIEDIDVKVVLPPSIPDSIENCFWGAFKEIYKYEPSVDNLLNRSNEEMKKFYETLKYSEDYNDVFNIERQLWRNPFTGKKHRDTFLELTEESISATVDMFSSSLNGKRMKVPDVSSFTNLPYYVATKLKYVRK